MRTQAKNVIAKVAGFAAATAATALSGEIFGASLPPEAAALFGRAVEGSITALKTADDDPRAILVSITKRVVEDSLKDTRDSLGLSITNRSISAFVKKLFGDAVNIEVPLLGDETEHAQIACTLRAVAEDCKIAIINDTFYDKCASTILRKLKLAFEEDPQVLALISHRLLEKLSSEVSGIGSDVSGIKASTEDIQDDTQAIRDMLTDFIAKIEGLATVVETGTGGLGVDGPDEEQDAYKRFLKEQMQELHFGESFTLQDIYIPLNAVWRQKVSGTERGEAVRPTAVVADAFLEKWLAQDKEALCLVSGGPGSGKSLLLKHLAAAHCDNYQVFWLPIRHLTLAQLGKDTIPMVNSYLKACGHFTKEVFPSYRNNVLVVDGLDELPVESGSCVDVARGFLANLCTCLDQINTRGTRLKVVLSAREQLMQVLDVREYPLLELLPYYVASYERDAIGCADSGSLLKEDKRHAWWRRYTSLKSLELGGLPQDIRNCFEAEELSRTPLLNYLVALSFFSNSLVFGSTTNIVDLYESLMKESYHRGYESAANSSGRHPALTSFSRENYLAFSTEAAFAVWHCGSMGVVADLESRCKGNPALAKAFEIVIASGPNALHQKVEHVLLALYLRQTADDSYEFVHKSIMEYLVVRELVDLCVKKAGSSPDEFLQDLADLAGRAQLTEHMLEFLRAEFAHKVKADYEAMKELQGHIIKLFCESIEFSAFNALVTDMSFSEAFACYQNTTIALLALHSTLAHTTNACVEFGEPDFYEWLVAVSGHSRIANPVPRMLLNKLKFSGAHLRYAHLRYANLEGADLEHANLEGADLEHANLEGANLRHANLEDANLRHANLVCTDLVGAHLQRTTLVGAHMKVTYLWDANLEHANLEHANLRHANLRHANLNNAYLKGANLATANLEGANLKGANLADAELGDPSGYCKQLSQAIIDDTTKLDEEVRENLRRYKAAQHDSEKDDE